MFKKWLVINISEGLVSSINLIPTDVRSVSIVLMEIDKYLGIKNCCMELSCKFRYIKIYCLPTA